MILFYSFAVLILAYYFFTVTSNHILFATPHLLTVMLVVDNRASMMFLPLDVIFIMRCTI